MRASIVVLGPLLAVEGRARVALPGGDDFGPRPIDMHVSALEDLGGRFATAPGFVDATAPDGLVGTRLLLEFPSVGATENAMMAGVLAQGTTTIDNAAREPEIADLADFLNAMGASVLGAGTPTITIEGVDTLHPATHTVISDRIEAATYLAAVGVAGGEVILDGARAEHMEMLLAKVTDMGMEVHPVEGGLAVRSTGRLRSVDIATLPYPGVATDYKPMLVAMLTTADGVGIVTENLFAGRFRYIDELVRMGADIRTEGHHAVVRGRPRLSGAPVRAPDIRAGAALVVAGLDGSLDLLTPGDAEAWLGDAIKPAILSFQDEWGSDGALVFWLPGGHSRVRANTATDEVGWLCHAPHGHQIDLGRILWGQANEYPQEILLRDGGRPAGLFHLRIT